MKHNVKVTGTQCVSVDVTLTPDAVVSALYDVCGLHEVNNTSRDEYWKLEDNALVQYEDISRHGSPCYTQTGRKIDEPDKVECYKLLEQLKPLIRNINKEE